MPTSGEARKKALEREALEKESLERADEWLQFPSHTSQQVG